ncbi:MAG: Cache 3/Cache 2 fusion domain-containing protein, partial [Telluria sp.]
MRSNRFNPTTWGVGAKVTAFTFTLVGIILAALVLAFSMTTAALLQDGAEADVKGELRGVVNMVEMFNKAVTSEVASFARILTASFDPDFVLDATTSVDVAGKQVPVLKNGGKPVNLDFTIPDRFTAQSGGNATIFVATGDD